jgi:hypothetical protein
MFILIFFSSLGNTLSIPRLISVIVKADVKRTSPTRIYQLFGQVVYEKLTDLKISG